MPGTETYGEIQGLEIFEAGTYRGRRWTETDIDRMVRNFQAHPEIKPPIVLGHNTDQPLLTASGMPAGGWLKNLWRSGKKLLADVADVPRALVDLIQKRAYRRTSAEIFTNFQGDGPAVRRVALIGGEMPEIKTLEDVAALYSEANGGETVVVDSTLRQSAVVSLAEIGDELAELQQRERPRQIMQTFNRIAFDILDAGDETNPKGRLVALVDELKSLLEQENFTEEETEMVTEVKDPRVDALLAKVEEQSAQIVAFTEALAAKDAAIEEIKKAEGHRESVGKTNKVHDAVLKLTEAGKWLPKWTEQGLERILRHLSDEQAAVETFAEGEGAAEETPLDCALRVLGTFPEMVTFAEKAKQRVDAGKKKPDTPETVTFTEKGTAITVPVPEVVAADFTEHAEEYAKSGTTLVELVALHRADPKAFEN